MIEHPFENEANQKLRRETLRNDRSTLLDHARAHADDAAGGRFKRELATSVVGVPNYPKQPETSPWHHDPVGPEPPLGLDVNAMEPVEAEIASSIAALADGAAMAPTESSPVVRDSAASSALWRRA